MNNSDNTKEVSPIVNMSWLSYLAQYFKVLFYVGLMFDASFSVMHIFFDEFAATMLAVLVVYLMYDSVIRPKICLPK